MMMVMAIVLLLLMMLLVRLKRLYMITTFIVLCTAP